MSSSWIFYWTFAFKQGPCQMGPMFWHPFRSHFRWKHVRSCWLSTLQPGQRVVPSNNWWWNVDSPLGLRHYPGVDAVETRQLSSAQEVPHSTVGWKVMATNFWDCKGVLLVDDIPEITKMTGPYYGEVLTNLRHAVKEKRRGMLTRGPLLLYGNAPVHMSQVAQAIVKDIGFWAAVSPTSFTRPDTQRLLPISTSEAAPSRYEVFRRWWTVAGHGAVSRQHATEILFDWNKRTFWQMWKVYWCTGRLHWKIM